jgi:hypothetical protein
MSVGARDRNYVQSSAKDPLSKKLDVLLDRVLINLAQKGCIEGCWEYIDLNKIETYAFTPNHVLQLIDRFLTKYKDSNDKHVLVALFPETLTGKFWIGDVSEVYLYDSTKYDEHYLRVIFSKWMDETPSFSIKAFLDAKLTSEANHLPFKTDTSTILYFNYPITRVIKVDKAVEYRVIKPFKVTMLTLGYNMLYVEWRRPTGTKELIAVVPTKCGSTTMKWGGVNEFTNEFVVARVPQCDKDGIVKKIFTSSITHSDFMLWVNT